MRGEASGARLGAPRADPVQPFSSSLAPATRAEPHAPAAPTDAAPDMAHAHKAHGEGVDMAPADPAPADQATDVDLASPVDTGAPRRREPRAPRRPALSLRSPRRARACAQT